MNERDYVLGTHDEEIERLGLQHRTWRPHVLAAWQRAGFGRGQALVDVGCGPGYASLDLADIVGPSGRVIAIDRSQRFLAALRAAAAQRALGQITAHERDLDDGALPITAADGAWCRWVLAFVPRPRALLERIAAALRPGGTLVTHEYFDYRTWRQTPRCLELEEFVQSVMRAWRADGGEPDIGLELPRWLAELGFDVTAVRPHIEMATPHSPMWDWPKAFVGVGLRRLVALGQMQPARAEAIAAAFAVSENVPHVRMVTPAVLEVIAVRR